MTDRPPPAQEPDGARRRLRPLAPGRYVDFLPVGEGGMGIVYWAVDSDLKRQVAFKVVRPPRESAGSDITPPLPFALRAPKEDSDVTEAYDHLTARFLQEAWVTGGMEHPGIAPVYELGETEAGVPYYTMKFVRGNRTLGTAIDELRSGTLGDRLKLLEPFLKVCDTIRYAHSRGVLHRDLKPDNIALGEFGEVVVLDWGLAKLADDATSDRSRWQGEVHAFRHAEQLETMPSAVGTPGYMSPEAARGLTDLVGERSDVYSLGVILFEILVAELPFAVDNFRTYQELVTESEPPDPAARVADVPGTLAAICQRAMSRQRETRTPSVDELATAIRDWQDQREKDREITVLMDEATSGLASCEGLHGETLSTQADRVVVTCRRILELRADHPDAPTVLDQAEAARERGIVEREQVARGRALRKAAGIGLAIAAIAAGVVAWMLEDRRQQAEDARAAAAQARTRAVADRQRAENVMGFMMGDLRESLRSIGRLDVLARLGQEARAYFEQIPTSDVTPRSLADGTRALIHLGETHTDLGDLPAAMKSFLAAAEIAARMPDSDEGHAAREDVRTGIAAVLIKQGFYRKALAMFPPANASTSGADSPSRRAVNPEVQLLLGLAHTGTFDLDQAVPHFRTAIAAARMLAREAPASARAHERLVRFLLSQRRALILLGRGNELLAVAEDAGQIVTAWRARKPKDVRWLRFEAEITYTLGEYAKWGTNDLAMARTHYATAKTTYEHLHEIDPLNAMYLSTLGVIELRLGQTTNDKATSLPHWQRSYEIQEQLVTKDPTNASWLHRMINLADPIEAVTLAAGGTHASTHVYREAAVRYANRLVAVDKDNPLARHLLAYALNADARHHPAETAVPQFLQVISLCEELTKESPTAQIELAVLSSWAAGSIHSKRREGSKVAIDRAMVLLDRAMTYVDDPFSELGGQLVGERLAARNRLFTVLLDSGEVADARTMLETDERHVESFAALAKTDADKLRLTKYRELLTERRERMTKVAED